MTNIGSCMESPLNDVGASAFLLCLQMSGNVVFNDGFGDADQGVECMTQSMVSGFWFKGCKNV